MIQNVGMKIRKDDPKLLKQLIIDINECFEKFTKNNSNLDKQTFKINFILETLNNIKLNKNLKINNPLERYEFYINFIKKIILHK